jgi:nicotinamidase-related amidase
MRRNNGLAKRSEKGLLTPDNCVVAFIDHQPQMLFGTSNFDRQSIINSTVALAKATRIFDLPVVLSTVEPRASAATCGLSSGRSSRITTSSNAPR